MGDDQILFPVELDLHRSLFQEQRVVTNLHLHGHVSRFALRRLPGLIFVPCLGEWDSRSRFDDAPPLNFLLFNHRLREIETYIRSLLEFFLLD